MGERLLTPVFQAPAGCDGPQGLYYKALFNIKDMRNQESHRTSDKKEKPYIKTWRESLPFDDVERGLRFLQTWSTKCWSIEAYAH